MPTYPAGPLDATLRSGTRGIVTRADGALAMTDAVVRDCFGRSAPSQ